MTHPYKHLENQKAWKILDKAIRTLIANGDMTPLTPRPYIVGYLLEQLQSAKVHGESLNGSHRTNVTPRTAARTRRRTLV